MTWLLLVSIAWGGGTVPSLPPVPVAGECHRSYAITVGDLLDPTLAADGVALCRGVVVPTSKLAYLLSVEAETPLHLADIAALKSQRAALRRQLNEQAVPWWHRAQGAAVAAIVTSAIWGAWYTKHTAEVNR